MTDVAAAIAEVEMLASVFGIPCRHAKVVTQDTISRALLDLGGMRPGQMSAQILILDIGEDGQLSVEIDTEIDGYIVLCGLRIFIGPNRVMIDDWRTSRGDDLLMSPVDCGFFTDKDAAWVPFDAGALGGYTKETPTGMGPMRMQLRTIGSDPNESLVVMLVGNVVDPLGCRFHADGPVYTSDLTKVVKSEVQESSERQPSE